MDLEESRGGGGDLEGLKGKEIVGRIYCMREKSVFNKSCKK